MSREPPVLRGSLLVANRTPLADSFADAEYRRHLATVYARCAITTALCWQSRAAAAVTGG